MVRFCGFDLELFVEDILSRAAWPALCSARDVSGRPWLVVQICDGPDCLAWLCAQVSPRALAAVVEGRAAPMDAVRHSLTGTVELVTVQDGRALPDRCLLCAEVGAHLGTVGESRVALAA
jgi:hypothetical protein